MVQYTSTVTEKKKLSLSLCVRVEPFTVSIDCCILRTTSLLCFQCRNRR
ncbi:unnamed protein product [Brassica oleracea]|uniref:Uncharacterized protein n=1 Tax=Brassica oleracea TaxID=3712 RepID=A0A3P6HF17_BRAOL|nr:unnamed protein product [Brassica oleracea]